MPKMYLCKIIRNLSYFKKGQKVWVIGFTGDLSYRALGRFRGKGRWVEGWIHTDVPDEYTWHHNKPDAQWVGEVEVSDKFYAYLIKIAGRICKNEYVYHNGF